MLAAGRGNRLRPLTDFLPKPMLPVAGRPIAGHTLAALAAAAVEAVALNLHHMGEEVRRGFGGAYAGLHLTYSEEEVLLGTLGALGPLEPFLAPADLVVVVNGDSLCQWPLEELVEHHRDSGADATLLVTKRAAPEAFGGGVGIDGAGRVVGLRPGREFGAATRRRVFAGAHVFAPDLLAAARGGFAAGRPADFVTDLYEPLLAREGHLEVLESGRRWFDLGTPERFLRGVGEWSRRGWRRRLLHRPWVAPGAEVAAGCELTGSVIEAGARVESGAVVEHSVLLPGARIGRGARVVESIVGFGARLGAGSTVERRVVTPARPGVAPRESDSVMGGLVYSPLA